VKAERPSCAPPSDPQLHGFMMPVPEILLVNDHAASLMAMESLLNSAASRLEFTVVLAQSGEEALRKVLTHEFAVILLDVNMPLMDGFETAEAIHSHPRSAGVPIIFITAHYADEIHRMKGYQQGAVDYLFTPVIPQILLTKVAVFVELRKKNLELQQKTNELASLNQDLRVQAIQDLKRINTQLEEEIVERKQAEERAHELAIRDSLTGLLNRRSLIDHLDHAISLSGRHKKRFALLFLDLDRFKIVNDTLGHDIGDKLLLEVSRRLTATIRESDTAARLGGDEFVIILESLASLEDISNVVSKISKTLADKYRINGHCVCTSATIGIATYPQDGDSTQALMKSADLAMYHAKQQQRGSIQYFHEGLNKQQTEHRQLQHDFETALEKKEFRLYFQPKMDVNSGKVSALEVHLRWPHPRLGLSCLGEIVSSAGDKAQLAELNTWMISAACEQAKKWLDDGSLAPEVPIIINLVDIHIGPELAQALLATLKQQQLPTTSIHLHVTERQLLPDMDNACKELALLRGAGITLGIDNFGVGYSSLMVLKGCSLSFLKTERSLIQNLDNHDVRKFFGGIVNLAHAMSLRVVADGVDNAQQLATLRELGCDDYQGKLACEPVTAENLLHELDGPALIS
jgi:diguanylate cyclase (GGDEF)-like protein